MNVKVSGVAHGECVMMVKQQVEKVSEDCLIASFLPSYEELREKKTRQG